jgi:hypothetical protein
MSADPPTNEELLEAARQGDEGALAALVERHRDRLERLVSLRLDPRAPKRLKGVFQGMPGGNERVWG